MRRIDQFARARQQGPPPTQVDRHLRGLPLIVIVTAGVFSRDEASARAVLSRVNAGSVYWNCCDRVSPRLPWSGHGDSGLGLTLSTHGIQTFTRPKPGTCGGLDRASLASAPGLGEGTTAPCSHSPNTRDAQARRTATLDQHSRPDRALHPAGR